MDLVVVFKPDGTIQCESGEPVPLEHHAAELKRLGASDVLGQANVPGPGVVDQLCGLPSGQVNAFAIPKADWKQIVVGTVGTLGFRLWSGAPYPELKLPKGCKCVGDGATASLASQPALIRDLIGRPGRCYRQGDALTKDFRPDRVNVELDETNRIADIWFG